MRIGDWSSDVCSSDLLLSRRAEQGRYRPRLPYRQLVGQTALVERDDPIGHAHLEQVQSGSFVVPKHHASPDPHSRVTRSQANAHVVSVSRYITPQPNRGTSITRQFFQQIFMLPASYLRPSPRHTPSSTGGCEDRPDPGSGTESRQPGCWHRV